MSDTSQGPGWWVASDGRWYPPQPDGSATTTTQTDVPGSTPYQGVDPTASDGSADPQGPDWWRASDGRWYPPVPGGPTPATPKKPLHRKVWFWLLIVVAVGFGGCVATVSVAGVAVDHFAHEHHTIVYSVTGTSQGTAITYATLQEGNGQNGSTELTATALPWTRTISASGLVTIYHVSAVVGPAGGSVTCSITDNGSLVSEKSAVGAFRSVSCNWGG